MSKDKKQEIVQARISPSLKSDFLIIVEKEYGSDRKVSEAIRDLIQDAVDGKRKIKRDKKTDIQAVNAMLSSTIKSEIRHIGNNINRWTTILQSILTKKEIISKSTLDKLLSSIEMLKSHLKDIETRISKPTDTYGT